MEDRIVRWEAEAEPNRFSRAKRFKYRTQTSKVTKSAASMVCTCKHLSLPTPQFHGSMEACGLEDTLSVHVTRLQLVYIGVTSTFLPPHSQPPGGLLKRSIGYKRSPGWGEWAGAIVGSNWSGCNLSSKLGLSTFSTIFWWLSFSSWQTFACYGVSDSEFLNVWWILPILRRSSRITGSGWGDSDRKEGAGRHRRSALADDGGPWPCSGPAKLQWKNHIFPSLDLGKTMMMMMLMLMLVMMMMMMRFWMDFFVVDQNHRLLVPSCTTIAVFVARIQLQRWEPRLRRSCSALVHLQRVDVNDRCVTMWPPCTICGTVIDALCI